MSPYKIENLAFGGRETDSRGYELENYHFASSGSNDLIIWQIDPYEGILNKEVLKTGNFSRSYTAIAYSKKQSKYLYAGTTTGDVCSFLVKNRIKAFNKLICANGVTSLVTISENQLAVGGGDGTLSLLYVDEPNVEILAKINLYGAIYSISASTDGVQMLAATDKGFIYRVRSLDLSNILLNENHTDEIVGFYSLNDANLTIGTSSTDNTIRLWSLVDYSVFSRINLSPDTHANAIIFDEDILISGWNDGNIRCFEFGTDRGKSLKRIMECRQRT